jgi:hypothetical protein
MLRAAPPGIHCKNLRWSNGIYDIGAMPSADGAADESVSPQSGIRWPAGASVASDEMIVDFDDVVAVLRAYG